MFEEPCLHFIAAAQQPCKGRGATLQLMHAELRGNMSACTIVHLEGELHESSSHVYRAVSDTTQGF